MRHEVNPKVAVAALRWSTDEQDISPLTQRAAIEAWARREGVTVVAWHEDAGVSGGAALEHRPGLLAAIDDLKAHGAGVLIVAKRDRLARDVLVACMAEGLAARAGAVVQSADGTGNGEGPEAELFRRLIDCFAAYERALIRARTKAAMRALRVAGKRFTRFEPWGATPAEGLAAVHISASPSATAAELAGYLRATGPHPRTGRQWSARDVERVRRSLKRAERARVSPGGVR